MNYHSKPSGNRVLHFLERRHNVAPQIVTAQRHWKSRGASGASVESALGEGPMFGALGLPHDQGTTHIEGERS